MKFKVGAAHFINGASCFIYKGSKIDLASWSSSLYKWALQLAIASWSSSLYKGSNFTVGGQHINTKVCYYKIFIADTCIFLPHFLDLEQRIPSFPNCDNYGSLTASNTDPLLDDTPTNDNELHQVICNTFKINYFQEMDTTVKLQNRLECKINFTLLALLPNKLNIMKQGPVTSGESVRNKRAIPALVIIQGIAAIGGMMIKGINALVDAKRASSFNNAIKLVNENVQITHD